MTPEIKGLREDRASEWPGVWEKNQKDDYSKASVASLAETMQILDDEAKTPEEAIKNFDGKGLTGFMVGWISGGVSYFHKRGEEYKDAWNEHCDPGGKKREGVINPALVTIGKKED